MDSIIKSVKKHWVEILLVFFASVYYGIFIFAEPLVDYDEATYAKVIIDTMESKDVSTFTFNGHDWFEKPPLYLWLAMSSVKVFGEHEFAFRIPSVLAALACLWLVFAITRELTGNTILGTCAFLILLFTPPFFVFAREARLDSGVIMAILATLLFYIRGWRNEKYLFWIFPAIAIGFLFKSVIAFLALPTIGIYSLFYKKWTWIKSKYLWWGLALGFIIFTPWHLFQTIRFGQAFWNEYLFHQVFDRGMNTITGTNGYYDYISILWLYYRPWLLVIVVGFILLFGMNFPKVIEQEISKKEPAPAIVWHELLAPLLSAIFIILFFTLAKTHLSTYIMPAFPFLAIFISLLLSWIVRIFKITTPIFLLGMIILVAIGVYKNAEALQTLVTPLYYEERGVGVAYKESLGDSVIPLYSLDWPHAETINYYGGIRPIPLSIDSVSGKEVPGPFYMVTNTVVQTYLVSKQGIPYPGYEGFKIVYQGDSLILLYAEKTVKMPVFSH
jgi:4-amino-4-deoxy-L-arabinose transferase-like glycosyltransferase